MNSVQWLYYSFLQLLAMRTFVQDNVNYTLAKLQQLHVSVNGSNRKQEPYTTGSIIFNNIAKKCCFALLFFREWNRNQKPIKTDWFSETETETFKNQKPKPLFRFCFIPCYFSNCTITAAIFALKLERRRQSLDRFWNLKLALFIRFLIDSSKIL